MEKSGKMHSGRKYTLKSIRLTNGNLLIPRRIREHNIVIWDEVMPGTSDYKRWLPVVVDEADPRQTEEYKTWLAQYV